MSSNLLLRRREMMLKQTIVTSPYDTETTIYLSETYSNDWYKIKSYGLSHPDMVHFINEDPELIVNLLDLGYIRWLRNDGGNSLAYIDLNCIGNLNTEMEMLVKIPTPNTNKVIAAYGNNENTTRAITIYTPTTGGTNRYNRFGDKYFVNSQRLSNNVAYTFEQNKNSLWINDNKVGDYNTTGEFTTPGNLNLFKTAGAVSTYYDSGTWISYFKLYGDYIKEMYPFITKNRNAEKVSTNRAVSSGTIGMIDVLNDIFYPTVNTNSSFLIVKE